MSMFPTPGAQVYYNEDGEVLGWDLPADDADYYCDECGFAHRGDCPDEDES